MATETAVPEEAMATGEDFGAMLEESFMEGKLTEGSVVKGTVISIDGDAVLIDVGLKSEGRVAQREFSGPDNGPAVKVGDVVDVYLERMEDRNGEAVLSREKARREEAWSTLEKAFKDNERVEGSIFGRVKGGFTVDLSGAVAFLPGSQVDVRPVRDITPLMGTPQPFQILKMDRRRGNIVVSRRAVLEESRAEQRAELLEGLKEGQVVEGMVKNLTDYGAFIDLGGVDGLLHVTDIAWQRVNHPSELLSVGQTINVQIIRFNAETQRISLGMKQLGEDPWVGVEGKYPVSTKFTGRVSNITDYGAFVELEPGVEGLVHVSEMSWTKKNIHPGKIVSTSQEVEVMVLDVDPQKRRISLGIKQCQENPWEDFKGKFTVDSEIEGQVKNITEFGMFVGLEGGIDGMVHLSDLDWSKPGEEALKDYAKGDTIKAKVLDIDLEKERISLGIKQMTEDPFESGAKSMKKGDTVTCTVSSVSDNGIEVTVAGDLKGFIRRADLSRERSEQRPDRFAVGDRLDARISNISRKDHKLTLSIKAHEVAEEKQVMKEYGSSDSGASLGDILGAVINRKAKTDKTAEEEAPAEKEVEAPPEVEAEAEVPAEAKEQGKKEENPAKKAATKKAKAAPKAKAKAEPKAKAKAKLKAKPKAKAKKVNDSEA